MERAGVVAEVPDPKVLACPSEQGRAGAGQVLELREFEGEVLEEVVAGAEEGDRPGEAALDLASPQRRDQPGQGQRRLAAARRAQDGQEPPRGAGAGDRRQAVLQQPVDLGLASKEERRVLRPEGLEAPVGAFALKDPLALTRPGWDAPDTADEVVECLPVVERPGELDPGRAEQEAGQPLLARRDAPGSTTGMTRYPPRLPLTRCSTAARISSLCQGLKPPGPMKTAQAVLLISASSSASCQGSPGIRFHLSRKGLIRMALSFRKGLGRKWLQTIWTAHTSKSLIHIHHTPRRQRPNIV